VMLALHLVSRESLGDGDVRLSPLLGLHLGWWNPGLALVGLFFGFVLGAVAGIAMMLVGRAGRRTAIPFGPFLAVGALVALFIGQDFVDVVMVR
ncbi:MAG: prepilin peptidase, partial [Ilumatobacteraceae bacterium]